MDDLYDDRWDDWTLRGLRVRRFWRLRARVRRWIARYHR